MIDALLATLEREAGAEVTRVMEEARAHAADLTAAAEQRMAERRAATLGKRETEARAQHERALAGLRLAARARVLQARAALLDLLFAALRAALPELSRSAAYRQDLAKEVQRLRAFAGDQAVTIRCTPALTTALQRLIKTNGHVRIRAEPRIAAGFRVTTADGALEVDGSLESRLARLRPQLALEAIAALFA